MARAAKKDVALTPKEKLAQALVPEAEQPYQVPENWCWVKQGCVSTFLNGRAYKQDELLKDSSFTPVLRVGNLFTNSSWYYSDLSLDNDKYIDANDLIYAWSASFGPFIWNGGHVIYHYHIWKILLSGALRKRYYYYWLMNDTERLKNQGHGTGMIHVTKEMMERSGMPLPPLAEQQRLVDRIESLFAKLDEAKEKAQSVVDGFEDRKAAILHKAFTGELTAGWRKCNNHPAENYIVKAREKRDRIVREKRVKKLKYTLPDDFYLPPIPDRWQYLQIGDITWSIKDGPHYSPDYVEEGIPFITGGNVRPDGVDFENAKRITLDLHRELSKRCHPEKGDMLYTKGGTTGIARVNTYDFEFSVWVHVAVIKYVDVVLPEYFQMVLNSPFCYEQSQKYTHGVGNQDLGLTRMINIIFPMCSISEQQEIIQRVGALIEKEQQAKEAAEQVIDQIDTMKKSILARAFRGELGTNDPADESAEELLKRIL